MNALLVDKLEGAGNDYVFVDGIQQPHWNAGSLAPRVKALADRHFGIGGDGVILLGPAIGDTLGDSAALRMVMWNADGSRGAFCGNGLRSLAWLAHLRRHVADAPFTIATDAGPVTVVAIEPGTGSRARIRHGLPPCSVATSPETVQAAGRAWEFLRGDAGNPHAVVFVDEDPATLPLAELGLALQSDPRFRDGVNVELVVVLGPDRLRQRTWERGSGETLACGSGATIAALAAHRTGRCPATTVHVELDGGELAVICAGAGPMLEGPMLEGPCRHVFRAEWSPPD